jgi:CubicO group peptidase (beta-lactamase class C family)
VTGAPPLDGDVHPAFAAVRDRFAELLREGAETGAAVAVHHRGDLVVDLWGGWADRVRTTPWQRDTIATTYSVTKVPAAVTLLSLVDRGRVGLDDAVASVWPEYGAGGKAGTTIRMLLAHQAGLPAFPQPRDAYAWGDWDGLTAMLAEAPAEWEPGTAIAEHALTYGHLLGEVVRRVDGRSLGTVWREDVAGPLDLDFQIGLRPDEEVRAAEVEHASPGWAEELLGPPGSLRHRALANPAGALDVAVLTSPVWRRSEVPAVNGHGTARALARFYAALAGWLDEPLLSPALSAEVLRPAAEGVDLLLERHVSWGLGPQLEDGYAGMGGVGGSDGMAHLGHGYAFGYVTRRLDDHARAIALADTVEVCLSGLLPT